MSHDLRNALQVEWNDIPVHVIKRHVNSKTAVLPDIYPSLAEHDMPCLSKQCRSRSVGFWSGSALFVMKYVNFYQKTRIK